MSGNRITGKAGEDRAAKYLEANGYVILDRNVRTFCEMDLVCAKDGRVCFVEVKSRSGTKFGLGRESVGPTRIDRYRKGAMLYLKAKGLTGCPVRFDVIEITGDKLVHLTNAF